MSTHLGSEDLVSGNADLHGLAHFPDFFHAFTPLRVFYGLEEVS